MAMDDLTVGLAVERCASRVYVGAEGEHGRGTKGNLGKSAGEWHLLPARWAWQQSCGGGGVEDVEGIRVSCVSGANQASSLIYARQSDLTRYAYRYFFVCQRCLPAIRLTLNLRKARRPQRRVSSAR